MNAAVLDARSKLERLLLADLRGPGDMRAAMERVARRHGLPYAALWALRYRPPKDVKVSVYLALCAAHASLRSESLKVHADERSKEAPKTVVGRALVGLAAAVDRANFGGLAEGDGR